jgi:hypothetical protein
MPDSPDLTKMKRWLQRALEIELATIPAYMICLLSIKLPGNREAAEIVRGVLVEEMLHMVLVSNVLNAIGGKPRVDADAIPRYPLMLTFEGKQFTDRAFPVDLAPFSEHAIKTFMEIERPRDADLADIDVQGDLPGMTIGEFYAAMIKLLEVLEAANPGQVFVGDEAKQFEADYFWSGGGRIIRVKDLASAREALELVAHQGEGAPKGAQGRSGRVPTFDMGHFFRFKQILHGRRYRASDDPNGLPTGREIAIGFNAVYPCKINPKSSDYPAGSALAKLNDDFNIRYTALLRQLEDAMNGAPKALYDATLDHMHALTPIAHEMMKLPLEDDPEGRTGCPTFEFVRRDDASS